MRIARVPRFTVAHGSVVLYATVGVVPADFRHGTRIHAFRVYTSLSPGTIVAVRTLNTQALHLNIERGKNTHYNIHLNAPEYIV